MFIHFHLPAFHTAVHQAIEPHLRGRPVAVAVDAGDQAVLFETSPEARALHVWPGLRAAAARRRCPGLIVVTPVPALYRRAQRALLICAGVATPRVGMHQHGLDLDLAGTESLWRTRCASHDALAQAGWWAAHLRTEITTRLHLPASAGVAVRLRVARLAALAARAQSDGVHVVPAGAETAACAPWPLRWQRELDHATLRAVADCGITTFGALAALPDSAARQLLGTHADAVLGVLSGEDEPVVPALVEPEPTLAAARDCGPDGADVIGAQRLLAGLARELGIALRQRAQACTRLVFSGIWLDGRTAERAHRPTRQLCHDDDLTAAAVAVLAALQRRVQWQRLELTAAGLVPIEHQLDLLAPPRQRSLQAARDQLRARFAAEVVEPGTAVAGADERAARAAARQAEQARVRAARRERAGARDRDRVRVDTDV